MILGCMIADEKGVVCEAWELADVILGRMYMIFEVYFLFCFQGLRS